MAAAAKRQFRPSALDNVEDIENYRPGGFHPIHIGDELQDRYKIVHKLGYGGFSTVWLARDKVDEQYVALKILAASSQQESKELGVLQKLVEPSTDHPGQNSVLSLLNNFVIEGPNGRHLCLVVQVAGPSIAALNYSPGAVAGSRRLRPELAVKVANQTVQALDFVHSQGFCHGDVTASNILIRLDKSIDTWSQEDVYERLGLPIKDEIGTISGSAPGASAPKYIVEPCSLLNPQLLSEDILLADFGCAFPSNNPPSNPDEIGLTMSYSAPEVIFDSKMSVYSDIWALGCVLFEIRSGAQLFGDWIGTKDDILRQMIQAFGKLPEPWWSLWDQRGAFFDDNGEPRTTWDDGIARATKFELNDMIAEIGAEDEEEDDPERPCAVMLEPNGVTVPEEEASQMKDLLEKILKWIPEERISIKEIAKHSWLS
ncbi:Protein kinase-like (PK-like) [Glarea lozoyensis ATCC 20868]|uniref:EKC/KEOPS complex subunit BUD32 n=1 Tax=Glarea lozoyensis (strain ATCC 20868 / MF5171) TaxID=1116229 RepID=S3D3A9_GLAL2|nr:Protein kinase-like (PK-like) [Glarea lozoyensis ATCC 20868]EPE32977.1 Protein kinase-like (PK-like) [Glarea lozoyensis ATCC 20868]